MPLFGISARRLHKKVWVLDNGTRMRASLFPFFDRRGNVRQIMIADWDSGTVRAAAVRPHVVELKWFAPNRLHLLPGAMHLVHGPSTCGLLSHWHVDPWWVLGEPEFSSNSAVPALRCTNAVHALGSKGSSVYFTKDLTRVRWMVRSDSSSTTMKKWDPAVLDHEHPQVPDSTRAALDGRVHASTGTGRMEWVLAPPWARGLR